MRTKYLDKMMLLSFAYASVLALLIGSLLVSEAPLISLRIKIYCNHITKSKPVNTQGV